MSKKKRRETPAPLLAQSLKNIAAANCKVVVWPNGVIEIQPVDKIQDNVPTVSALKAWKESRNAV